MRSVPLSGLLARALGDLTSEFVAHGAGGGGMPSVPMWFGLLRAIPVSGEVAQRELPVQTRLSKRAVRQLVGAATRSHWIEVRSGTGVQASLGLTGSGRKAAAEWAAMADATELSLVRAGWSRSRDHTDGARDRGGSARPRVAPLSDQLWVGRLQRDWWPVPARPGRRAFPPTGRTGLPCSEATETRCRC